MKRIIILAMLAIAANGFCDQPTSTVDAENIEQISPSHHSANWLYVPAAALMTWGVYELGEAVSDDGWTYVGVYWGTAAVISVGLVTYQHYSEPKVSINAGFVGKEPGVFLAYRF